MEDFIAYHGLQGRRPRGFTFGDLSTHPEGIHLGTLAQARMRAGRGTVLKVRVKAGGLMRIPRLRDRALHWRKTLRRRARAGDTLLCYLNRYEGIPHTRFSSVDEPLDDLPDARFRKLVPEAHDSWIALDPSLLEIVGSVRRPPRVAS